MERKQELRDARTVEIAFAVIVGSIVAAVAYVGTRLVGRAVGEHAPATALVLAVVLGVGTTLWLLLRARRRGI